MRHGTWEYRCPGTEPRGARTQQRSLRSPVPSAVRARRGGSGTGRRSGAGRGAERGRSGGSGRGGPGPSPPRRPQPRGAPSWAPPGPAGARRTWMLRFSQAGPVPCTTLSSTVTMPAAGLTKQELRAARIVSSISAKRKMQSAESGRPPPPPGPARSKTPKSSSSSGGGAAAGPEGLRQAARAGKTETRRVKASAAPPQRSPSWM